MYDNGVGRFQTSGLGCGSLLGGGGLSSINSSMTISLSRSAVKSSLFECQ
jgi:hypothetical protein